MIIKNNVYIHIYADQKYCMRSCPYFTKDINNNEYCNLFKKNINSDGIKLDRVDSCKDFTNNKITQRIIVDKIPGDVEYSSPKS